MTTQVDYMNNTSNSASGPCNLSGTTVNASLYVPCGFRPNYVGVGVKNANVNSGQTYVTYENGDIHAYWNNGTEQSSSPGGTITIDDNGFYIKRLAEVWTYAYYIAVG